MKNIISFTDFSNGLLVKKKKYEQLWPGTIVKKEKNVDIIAYRDGFEHAILEDGVVSPMVKPKLFHKVEPDPSIYELIFFNTSPFAVSTGVKVRYKDTDVNNVKINAGVQCKLQCQINNPRAILRNFTLDDELSVIDVKPIIINECTTLVRAVMANIFKSSGDVDAQEELQYVCDSVKKQLNISLDSYGMIVKSMSISYETDSEHDAMVYDVGINEYVEKKTSKIANMNRKK